MLFLSSFLNSFIFLSNSQKINKNKKKIKCIFIYLFLTNSSFQFLTELLFDKTNITLNKYWILILKQFSCISLCSAALSQGEYLEDYWQVIIRFIFIKTNINLLKFVAKMHDKLLFSHYLHCTAYQYWRPGFPKAIYSTGNTSRKNLHMYWSVSNWIFDTINISWHCLIFYLSAYIGNVSLFTRVRGIIWHITQMGNATTIFLCKG